MIFNFVLLCAPLPLTIPEPVKIQIEHAYTPEQRSWGLMQRKSLPENYGMLFNNSPPTEMSLWSFNCYLDLAVAFIDEIGMIQEIGLLKAYPEKMDPKRTVNSLNDFKCYPAYDPIVTFFHNHRLHSRQKAAAALETDAHFFHRNDIRVGDILLTEGIFLRPINIINLNKAIYLLSKPSPVALKNVKNHHVKFLDSDNRELNFTYKSPIIYCSKPVFKILIE
jgi:uncharacterized membrane protein (UPF0127 family)